MNKSKLIVSLFAIYGLMFLSPPAALAKNAEHANSHVDRHAAVLIKANSNAQSQVTSRLDQIKTRLEDRLEAVQDREEQSLEDLDERISGVFADIEERFGARECPPGHFIAPGFNKNFGMPACVPDCATLPPGIAKKIPQCHATTTPPVTGLSISNITQIVNSPNSATISWQTNQPSNSTVLYATSTPIESSASLKTASSSNLVLSHTLTLTNLFAGTTYYYKVMSATASTSVTSELFTFTTPSTPVSTAPVISNVAVTGISTTSATINWQTSTSASSKVYYATSTPVLSAGSLLTVSSSTLTTSHALNLHGLAPNTTYFFLVESSDSAGRTSTSTTYSFMTSTISPSVPTITNVSLSGLSSSTARISWQTNVSATSQIFFATSSPVLSSPSLREASSSNLVTSHSLDISDLKPSTKYFFLVSSTNGTGQTSTSSEYTFTTSSSGFPTITDLMVSNLASTSATIKWSTDIPATGSLYYATSSPVLGAFGMQSLSTSSLSTSHVFGLTGLLSNTTYYYFVTSSSATGQTSTSTESSFSTGPILPLISEIDLTIGSTTAEIAWLTDLPSAGGVWYGTTSPLFSSSSTPIFVGTTTASTTHSAFLTNLATSTTYFFQIVSSVFGNTATTSTGNFTTGS